MAASTLSSTQLEILLVGKAGSGKSSSGNSILEQDVFPTSDSSVSVTSETVVKFGKRNNYFIKVVDTPGVFGTNFSGGPKKMIEYAVDKLSESFYWCPNGFHAVALVLKYPLRMTAEEDEAVNQFRKIFGEDFIKNHCVIIVTNGENFDLEAKRRKHESFEKWCEIQDGTFGYFVKECNNRVVLFYNLCDDDRKTRAVDKFLSLVTNIGNRYTNDEFNKWKKNRDALIVKSGLVQLKENIQPKIDIVVNKLTEIYSNDSTDDMLDKLSMLKAEVEDLKIEIDNEDRDTDVLISFKTIIKDLDQSINRTIEGLKKAQQGGSSLASVIESYRTLEMMFMFYRQLTKIQVDGRVMIEKARIEARSSRDRCIIS